MDFIRKRLPGRSEMLAVLGVVVFVCYSWTLLGFLNKLSSFMLYFTLGEIADIFVFMMAFALLESLAVTGILVLLSILLPSGWLRDGFAFKGFVILVIATVTSILFQRTLNDDFPPTFVLILFSLIPLGISIAMIVLSRSMPKMRSIVTNIQDRVLIMLFVYIPVGLLSLIVVLYRNLL